MLTTRDTISVKVIDEPILLAALFLSPSPSFNDKFAAAPFPISPAMALNIITSGNITLVAALPSVPTPLPINT